MVESVAHSALVVVSPGSVQEGVSQVPWQHEKTLDDRSDDDADDRELWAKFASSYSLIHEHENEYE